MGVRVFESEGIGIGEVGEKSDVEFRGKGQKG